VPPIALLWLFQEGFAVLFCAGTFQRRDRSQWHGALLGLTGLVGVIALTFAFRRPGAPLDGAPAPLHAAFGRRGRIRSESRTRIPAA
jgi:peptidoglycan/LPS O-acetylase OafA/YrhL